MRSHGVNQRETIQMVDGMQVNSNEDCVCMGYFDDALQAEASITTSALPPDNAAGGIRVNSIPKDGGNAFSGNIFLGGTNGTWQANNIDVYFGRRTSKAPTALITFRISTGRPAGRSCATSSGSSHRHAISPRTRPSRTCRKRSPRLMARKFTGSSTSSSTTSRCD